MFGILIAGDIASQKYDSIINDKSFGDVTGLISACDYSIANLETPVGDIHTLEPIPKQGPCLLCPESRLDIIKEIGFKAVTLANNHIYDYGERALNFTIQGLKKRKIDYVGAGCDRDEASSSLIIQISDKKIGIINCCEKEFSIATLSHGGANALDTIELYYQIQNIKTRVDFLLVIIHGGVEYFQYPTPRMVKTYRFFIDSGADVIVNHHQHCPCGYEKYHNKSIFYGLGNFCFDWFGKKNSIWNIGYMVKLSFNGNSIEPQIIPYTQCNGNNEVKLLRGAELDSFMSHMDDLNDAIQDENMLVEKLKKFNSSNDFLYRKMLEPYFGRFFDGLYKRGLLPSTIKKDRVMALTDFLICESHYERVKELLERYYNQYYNE